MVGGTAPAARYALSFTSGALLMREAVITAPLYLRERDWSRVRALIAGDNLLQARTALRQVFPPCGPMDPFISVNL